MPTPRVSSPMGDEAIQFGFKRVYLFLFGRPENKRCHLGVMADPASVAGAVGILDESFQRSIDFTRHTADK
jgi:hypothetical protein